MAKSKSRNYLVALSKVRQYSNTKEWCGCVTPSEAAELISHGAVSTDHSTKYMERMRKMGESGPVWFYFVPSQEIIKDKKS